jgi:hypothetical protein
VGLGWLVNAYSRHFVDGGRDGPVQADKAKEVGPQSHMGGEGGVVMGTNFKGVGTQMQGNGSTMKPRWIMEGAILNLI